MEQLPVESLFPLHCSYLIIVGGQLVLFQAFKSQVDKNNQHGGLDRFAKAMTWPFIVEVGLLLFAVWQTVSFLFTKVCNSNYFWCVSDSKWFIGFYLSVFILALICQVLIILNVRQSAKTGLKLEASISDLEP